MRGAALTPDDEAISKLSILLKARLLRCARNDALRRFSANCQPEMRWCSPEFLFAVICFFYAMEFSVFSRETAPPFSWGVPLR